MITWADHGVKGAAQCRVASVHVDFNWKAWQTDMQTVQEANQSTGGGRKWKCEEETSLFSYQLLAVTRSTSVAGCSQIHGG